MDSYSTNPLPTAVTTIDSISGKPKVSTAPFAESEQLLVKEFLDKCHLSQYIPVFMEEGFETLQAIMEITEEDLIAMNVKRGHRRVIQRGIATLKGVPKTQPLNFYGYNNVPMATVFAPSKNSESDTSNDRPNRERISSATNSTSTSGYGSMSSSSGIRGYHSKHQHPLYNNSFSSSSTSMDTMSNSNGINPNPCEQQQDTSPIPTHHLYNTQQSPLANNDIRSLSIQSPITTPPIQHVHSSPTAAGTSPISHQHQHSSDPHSYYNNNNRSRNNRQHHMYEPYSSHRHQLHHILFPTHNPPHTLSSSANAQAPLFDSVPSSCNTVRERQEPRRYNQTSPPLSLTSQQPRKSSPLIIHDKRSSFSSQDEDDDDEEDTYDARKDARATTTTAVDLGENEDNIDDDSNNNSNNNNNNNNNDDDSNYADDDNDVYGDSTTTTSSSHNHNILRRKYKRHPKLDKNAPIKPPSAYIMFSNDARSQLKDRHQLHTMSFVEIAKLVGDQWKNLSPDRKQAYERTAMRAKDEYIAALNEYRKTKEYKEYQKYLKKFKAEQDAMNRKIARMRKKAKERGSPGSGSLADVSSNNEKASSSSGSNGSSGDNSSSVVYQPSIQVTASTTPSVNSPTLSVSSTDNNNSMNMIPDNSNNSNLTNDKVDMTTTTVDMNNDDAGYASCQDKQS